MLLLSLALIVWIACGILACGWCFAYKQRVYHCMRKEWFDMDRTSAITALLGGAGSVFAALVTRHYEFGWLWPWSERARKEAGL